jgi:uncharacterized membrane protein
MNILRPAALGLVAGMRTTIPLASISDYLMHHEPSFNSRLILLGLPQVATLLKLAAIGELVIDKVPDIPARTTSAGLLGRGLSGMLAGTVISAAHNQNRAVGALLGGTAAVLSTFGMYHLRRQIGLQLDIPDPVVGGLEDALAVGTSVGVLALD